MKSSMHLGKGSGKHNDRTFDLDKADHIDQERTDRNRYVIWSKNEAEKHLSFEEYERLYYERNYSESLKATNDKYLAQRHPERVRTMDDWLKTYKPTEAIIQIGNMEEQVNDKYLVKAFNSMNKELRNKYPQLKPLDVALHRDEATPHIHFRFVIEGHDKSGHLKPLKTQGLKEMGIERPDLTRPEGRYNNPLITFTNELRETLYRHIEELGLDLDKEPRLNQQHKDTLQYKKDRMAEDIQALEEEKTRVSGEVHDKKQELTELDKSYDQKTADLQAQFEIEQAKLREEYDKAKEQIAERKANLVREEKALTGRELEMDELKELEQKRLWSPEDKQNVLKTAQLSARNSEKADEMEFSKNKALKENKALKTENKQLKAKVPSPQQQLHYDALESRIKDLEGHNKALKQDIKVRDNFIREKGLMPDFMNHIKSMGIKLVEKVKEIQQTMHIR